MSPLYLFNNKLLLKDSKLAHSSECCCIQCRYCHLCGCNHGNQVTYQQLWDGVQEYIDFLEITCSSGDGEIAPRNPIRCGQWKPASLRKSLCEEVDNNGCCCDWICYYIYGWYARLCGLSDETISNISPSELDQRCQSPLYFHPTSADNGFLGNNQENKYLLSQLDISQKINDPIYNITVNNIYNTLTVLPRYFSEFFSAHPVDFVKLKNLNYSEPNSPSLITGNEETIVENLLKSGSYPPYSGVEYYTNINDCKNCFGSLYKLGTPDPYGRQSVVVISGILLNANSGDQLNDTNIFLGTSETLTISECIGAKYNNQASIPIAPYGILTDELAYGQTQINNNISEYANFDISYLYEITWDNPEDPETTWTPFTNKWKVWKGANEQWAVSGYSGNLTKSDVYDIPDLNYVVDSGLVFNPINTGVQIRAHWRNWFGLGVLIGNNNCDFEDQPFPSGKLLNLRSEPTLTISSTGNGSGCSFVPTLQKFTETVGLSPYWAISQVTINGSGSGYSNNETLSISTAPGDTTEVSGILKLQTTPNQYLAPEISGTVVANPTIPAILSISTEKYQNDPARWRVNDIIISNSGSGCSDGVYNIDFKVFNNSTEVVSATGIAVTERLAPEFTFTIVNNISEPSLEATVDAVCLSPAVLALTYTKYQTNPNRWRINNINMTDNGFGYEDGVYTVSISSLYGTTIETPATIIATTKRNPPLYEHNLITSTGLGASISSSLVLNVITNNIGQKAWNFDSVQCGDIFPFTILDGGYGYSSEDYIEISIENSVIDTNFSGNTIVQYTANKWRLFLQVDEETGSIVGINNNETFTTEAFYIPTGEIDVVKIVPTLNSANCDHSYPNDNEILYGGSYYKQGSGLVPGIGQSLNTNSNGQKCWTIGGGYCAYDPASAYYGNINCGSGYTNDDYIEIVLESGAIKDEFYSTNPSYTIQEIEPGKFRIYLDTFEGVVSDSYFGTTPAYYKPTGKIEKAIIKSPPLGSQQKDDFFNYPPNNPALYGGSYYKEIIGGIPTGVLIENSGKYYHPHPASIRAISGPCVKNIEADIWHPGPCGISTVLETETSMNTPWKNTSGSDGRISGSTFSSQSANFTTSLVNKYLLISNGSKYLKYKVIQYLTSKSLKIESIFDGDALIDQSEDRKYHIGGTSFEDLIHNKYTKSFVLYKGRHPDAQDWGYTDEPERRPIYQDNPAHCPCCTYTNLGLIVTKYEGCESYAASSTMPTIPLAQWEIDIQHCERKALLKSGANGQVGIGVDSLFYPYRGNAPFGQDGWQFYYHESGTICTNGFEKIPVYYRACDTSYPNLYWGRQNCRSPGYLGNPPPDPNTLIDYSQPYSYGVFPHSNYDGFYYCVMTHADRESSLPSFFYCDIRFIPESGSIKCENNRYILGGPEWYIWQFCPNYGESGNLPIVSTDRKRNWAIIQVDGAGCSGYWQDFTDNGIPQ